MLCLSCATYPLEPCNYKGQQVEVCPRCGGLWCETGCWSNEFTEEPLFEEPPSTGKASARSCVRCQSPLAIVSVYEVEGLQLERCGSCRGVWFDRGEWEKLSSIQVWKSQLETLERPPNWTEWFFQQCLRLPVEFNIRPRSTPWMTLLIIVVCTLLNLLAMDPVWDEKLMAYAVDGHQSLTPSGCLNLITYQFLHAGWFHLLPNMYLLYVLGDNVEDVMGSMMYLLFYLTCGVAAAVAQILCAEQFGPQMPLVGASGSISGVIAAYVVLYRRSQLTFVWFFWQYKLPAVVWIAVWLIMQIVVIALDPSSQITGVAMWAHVGGFLAGLILILPCRRRLIASHTLLDLLDHYKMRVPPVRSTIAAAGDKSSSAT